GIGGQDADGGGGETHRQEGQDQGRLAADPIPEVTEYEGSERARGEADELGAEECQGPGQRVFFGQEQLGEDQRRGGVVEEEVVPLDRGPDRAGGDRPYQLATFRSPRRHLLQVLHPTITSKEICPLPPFGPMATPSMGIP